MNRMMQSAFILSLILCVFPLHGLVLSAQAAVIHVPGDQLTIQDGIDAANSGDIVLVADGVYTGVGNRNLNFQGKMITVQSENGPWMCIIDCQQSGRGFIFNHGETNESVLQGFTICNGQVETSGAGISISGASPVITGNIIRNNVVAEYWGSGGGISAFSDAAIIADNIIVSNAANGGGGLSVSGNLTIRNNLICDNWAYELGGGIATGTDGMPLLINNTIAENWANDHGGGIFAGNAELVNCIIWNNYCYYQGPDGYVWGYGYECYFAYSYSEMGLYWYVEDDSTLHPGPGNIVADPRFAEGPWSRFYLSQIAAGQPSNSPCMNTGDPLSMTPGGSTRTDLVADSQRVDMGFHMPVVPGMYICHDEISFEFTAQVWGDPPSDQLLDIWRCGSGTLDWTARSEADWLVVSPDSGSSTGEVNQVTVGVESSDLSIGVYLDEITISAPGAENDPIIIPVRLEVEAAETEPMMVTGPGPSPISSPLVRVFLPENTEPLYQFSAYGSPAYGVRVSGGDPDGDGAAEIITGAGPGEIYGPHVRGFEVDGTPLPGLTFLAYGTNKYGVNVAAGDLDGDGFDEVITGAGPGAVFGPHVRGWKYNGASGVSAVPGVSYFAYGTPKWGVNVACGDIDGDGFDEIVTGPGPGAVYGPHVRGWNVDGGAATAISGVSFLAYGTNKFGVHVSAGDVDGDGIDEIVTGAGPGSMFGSHVRGWNHDGTDVTPLPGFSFFAWETSGTNFGAMVSSGADLDYDGRDELLVGRGPDPAANTTVKAFTYDGAEVSEWFSLEAYPGYTHGANVTAGWF